VMRRLRHASLVHRARSSSQGAPSVPHGVLALLVVTALACDSDFAELFQGTGAAPGDEALCVAGEVSESPPGTPDTCDECDGCKDERLSSCEFACNVCGCSCDSFRCDGLLKQSCSAVCAWDTTCDVSCDVHEDA